MTDDRDAVPGEPPTTDADELEATDTDAGGTGTDAPDFAGPEADTDETVIETPDSRHGPGADAEAGPAEAAAAAGAAAPGRRPIRPSERRAARGVATTAPTPSEQAVHVEDRASKWFVIGSIAVFVAILLNAMLLGQGGALVPDPTPTPVPTASSPASPPVSPSVSGSPAAGASPSAGASPPASRSAAPSGSAVSSPATVSPSAAAS